MTSLTFSRKKDICSLEPGQVKAIFKLTNHVFAKLTSEVLELIRYPLPASLKVSETRTLSKLHYLIRQLHEKLSYRLIFHAKHDEYA